MFIYLNYLFESHLYNLNIAIKHLIILMIINRRKFYDILSDISDRRVKSLLNPRAYMRKIMKVKKPRRIMEV